MPTDPDFFARGADKIVQSVDASLGEALGASRFPLREKLALACRILADEGHALTLAGQITVRGDPPDTFWTTNLANGFADVRVSNLLRMDGEMNAVEGPGFPNPATRFHLWVYRARPEINGIVHTHPTFCSALSMTGEPLAISHMDAMMFHEDCARLDIWPGVPLANEEGRAISEALGRRRAILLAHHGLLTTGKTLEEAVYAAVLLEHAARLHVLARSVGTIRPVPDHLAQDAHDFLLKESIINGTFDYWARLAAGRHPEALR